MKKYSVFGVQMTSMQKILFSEYLSNNKIAMNTLIKSKREEIANNWIKKQPNP